ncbi:MAG: hypothetical protein Q8P41_19755 [Pseudomonadota bacterium]|nr:hypothetical protein [Pseudomonadota bacterium]
MRALALSLAIAGCAGTSDDGPVGVDTDTGGVEDSAPPVEKVDTGLALVYTEGRASLTAKGWLGEEAYVATSIDGAVEHCRVTNPAEGVPSAELCPGCTFAFDIVLGAGSLAGAACENMRVGADLFDGDRWTYAFAPTYAYGGSGYTYDDVLLFGYAYDDTFVWTPWAFAEVSDEGAEIDYESIFAYTAYYYEL